MNKVCCFDSNLEWVKVQRFAQSLRMLSWVVSVVGFNF